MIRHVILCSLAVACLVPLGSLSAQPRLAPGGEGRFDVPGYDHPSVIYIPEDYRPGLRLPLIFFLHGAGAQPTIWPWKPATDAKGYIIVGLSYGGLPDAAAGGIPRDNPARQAMIKFIEAARAEVDRIYGIDQRRVFLTGLSMGGWGVNHYGFHAEARGRYRGYCIIAAGIAQGAQLELDVLKGKPLLLLNGETDANLAAANRGKPQFEEAGAIVTQVILPGEGHVPSIESMTPHLRKWLDGIAREDERSGGVPAVTWDHGEVTGSPPRGGGKNEAVLAFLKEQDFFKKASAGRPVMVFCTSTESSPKGGLSKQARQSALVERDAFRYPGASDTPAVASAFACVRVDLSRIGKKENAYLNRSTAPLILLVNRERSSASVLTRGKLKDRPLATEMRKLLNEEELREADHRLEKTKPTLQEMAKLFKAMESERKAIVKLRKRPANKVRKKLEKHTAALTELEGRFDALRETLTPKGKSSP